MAEVDELRTSIVGAKDLVVTILPSPLLTSFEALGAVMDWPMVAAVLPGTPLAATDCPDVALHSLTAIGEVSCVGIAMADATAVLQTELNKCLADDLRGSETETSPRRQLALTFRRSSSRVQFDLTMNE